MKLLQEVAAALSPIDPTLEELADVKTAVSEAVTNAIIGYENRHGIIRMVCRLYKNSVEVKYRTKARASRILKRP